MFTEKFPLLPKQLKLDGQINEIGPTNYSTIFLLKKRAGPSKEKDNASSSNSSTFCKETIVFEKPDNKTHAYTPPDLKSINFSNTSDLSISESFNYNSETNCIQNDNLEISSQKPENAIIDLDSENILQFAKGNCLDNDEHESNDIYEISDNITNIESQIEIEKFNEFPSKEELFTNAEQTQSFEKLDFDSESLAYKDILTSCFDQPSTNLEKKDNLVTSSAISKSVNESSEPVIKHNSTSLLNNFFTKFQQHRPVKAFVKVNFMPHLPVQTVSVVQQGSVKLNDQESSELYDFNQNKETLVNSELEEPPLTNQVTSSNTLPPQENRIKNDNFNDSVFNEMIKNILHSGKNMSDLNFDPCKIEKEENTLPITHFDSSYENFPKDSNSLNDVKAESNIIYDEVNAEITIGNSKPTLNEKSPLSEKASTCSLNLKETQTSVNILKSNIIQNLTYNLKKELINLNILSKPVPDSKSDSIQNRSKQGIYHSYPDHKRFSKYNAVSVSQIGWPQAQKKSNENFFNYKKIQKFNNYSHNYQHNTQPIKVSEENRMLKFFDQAKPNSAVLKDKCINPEKNNSSNLIYRHPDKFSEIFLKCSNNLIQNSLPTKSCNKFIRKEKEFQKNSYSTKCTVENLFNISAVEGSNDKDSSNFEFSDELSDIEQEDQICSNNNLYSGESKTFNEKYNDNNKDKCLKISKPVAINITKKVKEIYSQQVNQESKHISESENIPLAVSNIIKKLLSKKPTLLEETLMSALEDCYSRFILNLPHEYLLNHYQLCFAIQEAYWWYDDYWFESSSSVLPKLSMRNFGFLLCEKCPLLQLYFDSQTYAQFITQWRRYCRTIPLRGAILINNHLNKVLMVQDWKGGHWMFPRGKVAELEDDVTCAIRELREEIGVDVTKLINANVFIETRIDEQPLKLFIIPGVLETTPFYPKKRKEISSICWIPLTYLPTSKKNRFQACNDQLSCEYSNSEEKLRFWNVYQFTESLLGWVRLLQKGLKNREQNQSFAPLKLNTSWDVNSNDQYSFASPPIGYNAFIGQRYANQILTENNTSMYCNTDANFSSKHRISLTSLTVCQPAEAKPTPLPPYVDESKWYSIPQNVSSKTLKRLQYPRGKRENILIIQNLEDSMKVKMTEYPQSLENKQIAKNTANSKDFVNKPIDKESTKKSRSILQDMKRLGLRVGSDFTENPSDNKSNKSSSLSTIIQKYSLPKKKENNLQPQIYKTTIFSESRIETFIDPQGIAKTQFIRNSTKKPCFLKKTLNCLDNLELPSSASAKFKLAQKVPLIMQPPSMKPSNLLFESIPAIQLEGPTVVRLGEKAKVSSLGLNSKASDLDTEQNAGPAKTILRKTNFTKVIFDKERCNSSLHNQSDIEHKTVELIYAAFNKFNSCRVKLGLDPIKPQEFFSLLGL